MPTTRRSTGRTSTGSNKAKTQQATQTKLAFHSTTGSNRISKRGADSLAQDSKAKIKAKEIEDAVDLTEEITETKAISPPAGPSIHTTEPVEITLDHGLGEDEGEVNSDGEEEIAEREAKKVTKSQMEKYWQSKERSMNAPRAHLKNTTVSERILREWDVNGKYGPCIGMTRTARWRRAHNLGLKPPIEVLAAILQEVRGEAKSKQSQGNEKMDQAMIDRLMKKSDGGV